MSRLHYSPSSRRRMAQGETTPLLGDEFPPLQEQHTHEDRGPDPKPSTRAILSILSVLLVGVFVSNADTTFLLAAYPQIASEFGALQHGAWLLTSYMLAMCAVQPLYGHLSSIFGRKPLLLVAYALYTLGSAVCAVATSMSAVILGRILAGMGGAGLVCLVSILITDLVPLREVAAYRSYVNIVQTVGRSVGAPLGGLVADRFGWRAAFRGVVPLTLVGAVLVSWKLENNHGLTGTCKENVSLATRLRRVDVLGAVLLATSISLALAALSLTSNAPVGAESLTDGGIIPYLKNIPSWVHLSLVTLQCGVAFFWWETNRAVEPIFPPKLLAHRAVWTSYLLLLLQNTAQAAATLSVPLFIQVTRGEDVGTSGLYLLPSVVGNTVGGLATGIYVSRVGRYRAAAVVSALAGVLGYGMMIWRWTAGPSFHPVLDDIWIFFAGLATGMAHSAAFMALAAGLSSGAHRNDSEDARAGSNSAHSDQADSDASVAIASSGIYLSGNVGGVIGLSVSSALLQGVLRSKITQFLDPATVEKVLSSIDYVLSLPQGDVVRAKIVDAYVDGFRSTFVEAMLCSALGLVAALCIREHTLR